MDDGKRGLEENIANVEMLPLPIPITNAREMEMSKCESIQSQQPMGNGAVPPTPWTVKIVSVIGFSLGAFLGASTIFTTMPSSGLIFVLSLLFIGCAVELRRGKDWARRFFAFIGVVCFYIFARVSFLLGEIAFHILVLIPLMSMPVLLYLPVSSKWFPREHHCMISYGLWLLLFAVFAFIFYVCVELATLCFDM
jgi:hypothetical protein